jgi:hypothetical protein
MEAIRLILFFFIERIIKMRDDLSQILAKEVLKKAEMAINKICQAKDTSSLLYGSIVRMKIEMGELTTKRLYLNLADFFTKNGYLAELDEFPGNVEMKLAPSIDGMYLICQNNRFFLHLGYVDEILEVSVWLSR